MSCSTNPEEDYKRSRPGYCSTVLGVGISYCCSTALEEGINCCCCYNFNLREGISYYYCFREGSCYYCCSSLREGISCYYCCCFREGINCSVLDSNTLGSMEDIVDSTNLDCIPGSGFMEGISLFYGLNIT